MVKGRYDYKERNNTYNGQDLIRAFKTIISSVNINRAFVLFT